MMDFKLALKEFKDRGNEIHKILHTAMLSTPQKLNDREYRLLQDQPVKRALERLMSDSFGIIDGKSADIIFKVSDAFSVTLSMKKALRVFSRKKLKGRAFTKPHIIMLTNTQGGSDEKKFEADALWAYQPAINEEGQKMAMGLMQSKTVIEKMYRTADQWQIRPERDQWDYYQEFDTDPTWQIDLSDGDHLLSDALNKCWDELFDNTQKQYKENHV